MLNTNKIDRIINGNSEYDPDGDMKGITKTYSEEPRI